MNESTECFVKIPVGIPKKKNLSSDNKTRNESWTINRVQVVMKRYLIISMKLCNTISADLKEKNTNKKLAEQ